MLKATKQIIKQAEMQISALNDKQCYQFYKELVEHFTEEMETWVFGEFLAISHQTGITQTVLESRRRESRADLRVRNRDDERG
jgi:hypothetical protein